MEPGSFDALMRDGLPRLTRAFLAVRGVHGANDAASEAVLYACRNRAKVEALENPIGYLYRVGLRATRWRVVRGDLPVPDPVELPHFEPGLVTALGRLPRRQRDAVWLVYGCHWTHAEVAEAMGIETSTVSTHATRGLAAIRREMGVVDNSSKDKEYR